MKTRRPTFFFRILNRCSLQRVLTKSAETAEKHGGIGCFDRVSNGRTLDHPRRWSRGKRLERWRNGRSRLVPTGVGIVIAMHMVSRTIKRNSHGALQEGKGEEWDFRVRFNRAASGVGESYYESNFHVPLASHGLPLVSSLLPIFASSPPPREFLSPTLHSSIPCSLLLYTSTLRLH